ncbi:MAG: L-threonine 3-dehydrogenase [Anaerolineae bacterium]
MDMLAVVKTEPAPGAVVKRVEIPRIGERDLLVRVKAAAICGTDIHIYEWTPYAQVRVKPPMIFGHEFCGEVVEVGSQVTKVKPGDLVAAETHIPCGRCFQCETGNQHICEQMAILGVHTDGAFAEYARLPEACAWKLPEGTSPELGAILEPLGVATHGVLVDRVDGRSVAVFGCGPIGLFALGVAAACGASQLFAVEVNPFRLSMAPSMAPQAKLINPREEDALQVIRGATGGRGVDVSIELTGNPHATRQAFKVLRKGGRISLVGLHSAPVELDLVEDIIYKETRVLGTTGRVMWDTWWEMDQLLASGKLDPMPVVTHRFGLHEISQAMELARSGEAGKVLLLP